MKSSWKLLLVAACFFLFPDLIQAQPLSPSSRTWIENPADIITGDPLAGWRRAGLEGYTDKNSVAQGQTITFYVSVRNDLLPTNYNVEIYRVGATDVYKATISGGPFTGQFFPLHDKNNQEVFPGDAGNPNKVPIEHRIGCNWPSAFTLSIPSNWPSGFYYAKLITTSTPTKYGAIPFVVKEDNPGSTSNMLVVIAWNTYVAYNYFGGGSLYWWTAQFDNSEKAYIDTVSFRRPFGYHLHDCCVQSDSLGQFNQRERRFINWAESNGYTLEYCIDLDVESDLPSQGLPLLSKYKAVLFPGHTEYWSLNMRRNISDEVTNQQSPIFMKSGGNVVFFAANNCYWKIDYLTNGANGLRMHSKKYDLSYLWRRQPEGPEAQWLAVQFHGTNYPGPNSANVVKNQNHWIFQGTNLVNGQAFGLGNPSQGIDEVAAGEVDQARANISPSNREVLAKVFIRKLDDPMETHYGEVDSIFSEMAYWEDTNTNARVFSAAGLGWCNALYGTDGDKLATMTNNILEHFSFEKYRGNIYRNLTWGDDEAATILDGDTYVLANKILTLSNNFTLTINPGVTLYVDGTLSIAGNATITGGGTIVTRGSGVVNVSSSVTVTVPMGGSLNLGAGSSWKFGSSGKLKINGSLTASGTSASPIVFDRSGATGTWSGIWIENATTASTLNYCTVRNTGNAIRVKYTSGMVTIDHATLTNNQSGFVAEYSSPFTIQNSLIQNNTAYGIWVTSTAASGVMKILSNVINSNGTYHGVHLYNGADAYLGFNTITGHTQHGVSCNTNSDPFMRGSSPNPDYGNNIITNNGGAGVNATNNSYPSVGINYQQGSLKDYFGYNEMHDNGGYEIANNNGSGTIIAERNYWSADHNSQVIPPAGEFTGSVDYLPVLPDSPTLASGNNGRALRKSSINFEEAFALEIQDEFQAAADLYLKLLYADPEADNVGFGVSGSIRCYKGMQRQDEIIALLEGLITSLTGTAAADNAKDHILPYLVQKGDFDAALAYANELLQKNLGSENNEPNYLFQIASIYLRKSSGNSGVDLTNGLNAYGDLIAKYPKSELASFADLDLEQLTVGGATKPAIASENVTGETEVLRLFHNHPNPFNPSTQIHFYLPTENVVAVRVYDMSGRMIKERRNGFLATGAHTVTWDGRDTHGKAVASGVYFSHVSFWEERKVAKMTLLR